MNFFRTCVGVFLVGTALFAQSLTVVSQTNKMVGVKDGSWHDFHLGVKNVSDETVNVRLRVDKTKAMPGHRVKFCFASACYEESTIESTGGDGTSVIKAGKSDLDSFLGDFRADSTDGVSPITFIFFNDANPTDKAEYTLEFYVGVSDVQDELNAHAFSASPNPVNELVSFRCDNPSQELRQLTIVDINGRTVGTASVNSDAISISTSNLPNGSYAALLSNANGMMSTTRFIVAH